MEEIAIEIQRIEHLSSQLCGALEPYFESIEMKRSLHPSFFGSMQVLRALQQRRKDLEGLDVENSRCDLFKTQELLNAPLQVQTSPVKKCETTRYAIESDNLDSFIELFVNALRAEQNMLMQ